MKTYTLLDSAIGADRGATHAVATSEFRPPRAGEWYISGAIPNAYRARADMSTPMRIARLVK